MQRGEIVCEQLYNLSSILQYLLFFYFEIAFKMQQEITLAQLA